MKEAILMTYFKCIHFQPCFRETKSEELLLTINFLQIKQS